MNPEARGPFVVTGAGGYVGRALTPLLAGHHAVSLGHSGWAEAIAAAPLRGAILFHLAARVHRPGDRDEALYLHDNSGKTRTLAEAAARAGARRLVFLSTIKVLGEESGERALTADDPAAPGDAYARSKWSAECELARIAASSVLEVVVVRAPLACGPGAAGNLRALLRLANSPWPLPFGALANRRTLVHVGDLAELLLACALSPTVAGTTLLAGDPRALSTPEIIRTLRTSLGRPARLFDVAPGVLEQIGDLAGQGERIRRLTRSLEVDVGPTLHAVSWKPRLGVEAGLADMAKQYLLARAS